MYTLGLMLFFGGYLWSAARGVQVSLLCIIFNFIFPPLSQIIFAIYEPVIRAPLSVMLIGLLLIYLNN